MGHEYYFLLVFEDILILCMYLSTHMYVPGVHRNHCVEYPITRVTNGCEQTCGCWESNLGPLEK